MSLDPEPIAVTLRVVAELDRLGIRYLVGGSIASSDHGRFGSRKRRQGIRALGLAREKRKSKP